MARHTLFLLIALPSLVGAVCNDPSNTWQLGTNIYTPANGYDCFQAPNQQQFMCTCYGNHFTMNAPCRCATTHICGTGSNVLGCVDKNNSEHICLCKTEKSIDIVENNPCGSATAVTTVAPSTSTSTEHPGVAYFCLNDGVYDLSMQFCHCPSGFSGRSCERFDLERVCDRIVCKNGGTCSYGHGNGTYHSGCVCPVGFQSEYCEKELIVGTCRDFQTIRRCDGYPCSESVESDGQTYFQCTTCRDTTWGALCDHHGDIPRCQRESDRFKDPYMHEQGKYFQCGEFGPYGSSSVYRNSCPKGLRYSMAKNLCVLPEYA